MPLTAPLTAVTLRSSFSGSESLASSVEDAMSMEPPSATLALSLADGRVVGWGDGDDDLGRVRSSAIAHGVNEAAGVGLRAVMGEGNLGFVLGQRHRAADCVTHGGDAERVVLGIGVVREQGRRRDVDGAAFCHGSRVVGGDGSVVAAVTVMVTVAVSVAVPSLTV